MYMQVGDELYAGFDLHVFLDEFSIRNDLGFEDMEFIVNLCSLIVV